MPRRTVLSRQTAQLPLLTLFLFLFAAGLSCGGGDGTTQTVTVASVVITAPTAAVAFQTLGRTTQFSAEAREADATPIPGTAITWSSSNAAAATVSAAGLVTAVANGSTDIRATATASGVQSAAVTVTVAQVASQVVVTPTAVAFGALGSTRQLSAEARDSSSAPLPGTPSVTWTIAGPGTNASISAGGLVTALAVGVSDTAVATLGAVVAKAPITVTQVVASVLVSSTGSDTLRTTGRTKSYGAIARDSQANTIPGAGISWSSTVGAVASVDAGTGLATALTDGTTGIRATSSSIFGQRELTVLRLAVVFDLTPTSATLDTPSGTQLFTSDARDSVDTVLPTSWLMRAPTIATTSPATGTTTTVTAAADGMTFLIRSAGTRTDSAEVTVSGQVTAPLTASVTIGDFFFRSVRNLTENEAIDTVGVGGTVTWSWTGASFHDVGSNVAPTFTSSPLQTSGQYQFTFGSTGTYQYNCNVHPQQMTGRIIVR
ncbi:MAG: Ig-like domain-containing protein [Gemmatimonadaceae bacterium]